MDTFCSNARCKGAEYLCPCKKSLFYICDCKKVRSKHMEHGPKTIPYKQVINHLSALEQKCFEQKQSLINKTNDYIKSVLQTSQTIQRNLKTIRKFCTDLKEQLTWISTRAQCFHSKFGDFRKKKLKLETEKAVCFQVHYFNPLFEIQKLYPKDFERLKVTWGETSTPQVPPKFTPRKTLPAKTPLSKNSSFKFSQLSDDNN